MSESKSPLLRRRESEINQYSGPTDVMVSSTCSTASIESAPAGFPGFTADNAADVATENTERRLVARERPVSTSETERFSGNSLQLSLPKKFSQFVNNNKTRNAQNKRASPSRLSSISSGSTTSSRSLSGKTEGNQ